MNGVVVRNEGEEGIGGGDQCKGLRSHESGSAGSCVHVPQAACCCTLGKGRGSSLMHGTAKGKEHTRAQPNERKKRRREEERGGRVAGGGDLHARDQMKKSRRRSTNARVTK